MKQEGSPNQKKGKQKALSLMLKPASSRCNLRCSYCFYRKEADSRQIPDRGFMTEENTGVLIRRLSEYLKAGDVLELGFQGGEPSLMEPAFYRMFAKRLEADCRAEIHWYFQTNGLRMDEEFLPFFQEKNVLVGLSLDMEEELHDHYRQDAAGKGSWKQVMETKRKLEKAGIAFNILSVLTPEMASHPDRIWNFIRRRRLEFVQFLPCFLPEAAEGTEKGKSGDSYTLPPELFSSFYRRLYDHWLKALQEGNYVSVKLFDDLVHLLRGEGIYACGLCGSCEAQLILEADLCAYPCDFFCNEEQLLGNLREQSIEELLQADTKFLRRERKLPPACAGCPCFRVCGGGCPVLFPYTCIRPERSETFCGYRELLTYMIPGLQAAGLLQRR